MKYANLNQLKQCLGPGCAALNPDLMAQLQSPKRKQDQGPALGQNQTHEKRRKPSVVIISLRSRLFDDSDNLCGGCKAIRDAIARYLGLDDADKFIDWEYGQIKVSKENEGTIVRITT